MRALTDVPTYLAGNPGMSLLDASVVGGIDDSRADLNGDDRRAGTAHQNIFAAFPSM